MRVFVTGAGGGIGSAVCTELITAGHEVLGLARSDASADALTAAGVSVLRGDLRDPETLRAGALESDGVIHLAFGHDFTRFEQSVNEEALAVNTFGAALDGERQAAGHRLGHPVRSGAGLDRSGPGAHRGPGGRPRP